VTRTVLIVEDEQSIRDILTELFDADGTSVITAATLADAQTALAQQEYHLIVTDLRLGGKRDGGLQVMAASGLLSPNATVIVLTAYPTTTCATPRSGSRDALPREAGRPPDHRHPRRRRGRGDRHAPGGRPSAA
jgi:DNA-binding NtrC family response regulator